MQITRRSFINLIGAATAFTAAAGISTPIFAQKKNRDGLFPLPVEVYTDPLYSITSKQFEARVGNFFTVTDPDGQSVQIVLTEVNILELPANTMRGYYGECYSLIFEGPRRHVFTQNKYEFQTDGLPGFNALIVPTGRRQRQYEVIVNRLTR